MSAWASRFSAERAHRVVGARHQAVVAEGVENERIWCELLAMGCDYGQGYFFSRPVEADAFFDLLQTAAAVSPFAPLLQAISAPLHDPAGAPR